MRLCLLSHLLLLSSCALWTSAPVLSPTQEVAHLRQTHELPSLAAALFVDGQSVFFEAQGSRRIETPEPVQLTDKFHLGSCTKAMTATLVGLFIDRGLLNWDTQLSVLLPHIKFDTSLKDLTIGELLTHQSGLLENPDRSLKKNFERLPVTKARRELATLTLSKPSKYPKHTYHYSNVGYIILGHTLEHLTKKSWEELMAREIFKPLGMNSCGFGVTSSPKENSPTQPWGHTRKDGKQISVQDDNSAYFGPSGTVHCNLADWQKFLQLHVAGFNGQSTFLKPATFLKLHSTPKPEESYTFGGWVRVDRKWADGPAFTHSGTNTFNYATTWWAPRRNALMMSVTNTSDAHDAMDRMITKFIQEFLSE